MLPNEFPPARPAQRPTAPPRACDDRASHAARLEEAQPPISAKAIGIGAAFFGIIVTVGAIADLGTGRYNLHIPFQAARGILVLLLGMLLFLLGTVLIGRSAREKR